MKLKDTTIEATLKLTLAAVLIAIMAIIFTAVMAVTSEHRARAEEPSAGALESNVAEFVCELQHKVRWQTPAWDDETCGMVTSAIFESAERHKLSPALLLAMVLNESTLVADAYREYQRKDGTVARDSGLMGIQCILGKKGRCTNNFAAGVPWRKLMEPETNIEIGARMLVYWRDDPGCAHKNHAFWAHYNHGPQYRSTGRSRHYPHRVAVLYFAISDVLHMPAPELTGPLTVHDKGRPARTADKPADKRSRELVEKIYAASPGAWHDGSYAGASEASGRVGPERVAIARSRRGLPRR